MLLYEQQTSLPETYIRKQLNNFLDEDMPGGDITSRAIMKKHHSSEAYLQTEEKIVFAGGIIFPYLFSPYTKIDMKYRDGSEVEAFETLATIKGKTYELLSKERLMLNLIQRMSGIATMTRKYAEIAAPYKVKILDTRKTTPGLRLFEKYAVTVGGGFNHRMDLSSGILIKDNHIKAAGSVKEAIELIKYLNYKLPVEIEVENDEQIKEALAAGADAFLLDNMKPGTVKKSVALIRDSKNGSKIMIEASGGINLSNLADYVKTGVDAISVGAITHSVKNSNIHLEFF